MKKIVSNLLVVSSQLVIGVLFLAVLFTQGEELNSINLENKNLDKMADAVSNLFIAETLNLKDQSLEELNSTDIVKKDDVDVETTTKDENEVIQEEKIENNVEQSDSNVEQEENNEEKEQQVNDYKVLETFTGTLTGYGPNCYGCSGITSSGYDVSNTITYNDKDFGEVRIVAADDYFSLYTIVRITNIPNSEPIIAIVLDRGGNVGFNRGTLFDLLFSSEQEALPRTENITFEILRKGA